MDQSKNDYIVLLVDKLTNRNPKMDFLTALDKARSVVENEE